MKKIICFFVFVVILGTIIGCTQNVINKEDIVTDVQINQTQQKESKKEESTLQNVDEENNKEEQVKDNIEEIADEMLVEVTPVSTSNLSNTVCAWGFVRKKDEVQPEIYGPYSKVLNAYDGIYLGNSESKRIYLTFDEGYENGYTASILDTLKEKNVSAAFFVTLPYVKQNEGLIKRMIEEGHIVGNHTVNHPSMPSVTDDEKLEKEVMDLHDYMIEK